MPRGINIIDPDTNKELFVSYDDLDSELLPALHRAVAGSGFVYPADSFAMLPMASTPFHVLGWLPKKGKLEIYGQPKCGKSMLALQLARCIGGGLPFLGLPTEQGRALYLQFELGERVLQSRLQATNKEYPNVFVGTSFYLKLDTPAGQELFNNAVKAVEPDVVIIDPWYKILTGDENESSDVKAVADYLDKIIDIYDCSVVLMHHVGKDISRGGRGSSILEDWVDGYIEMKRVASDEEEGDLSLRVRLTPKLLRHAEIPPEPIDIVMENFEFRITNGHGVYGQVKDYMLVHSTGHEVNAENLFDKEVGQGIGTRGSVYAALKKLVDEKLVEKVARGSYRAIGVDRASPMTTTSAVKT